MAAKAQRRAAGRRPPDRLRADQAPAHADALAPLGARERDRLHRRLRAAVARARRSGRETLAAISLELRRDDGPLRGRLRLAPARRALVRLRAARTRAAALAGLGCAVPITGGGAGRFRAVAERWRELAAEAVADVAEGPPGAGLLAFGGFAFAPDGCATPQWRGFEPASMIVPEVALARGSRRGEPQRGSRWRRSPPPTTSPSSCSSACSCAWRELRSRPLALLDPAPTGRYLSPARCPRAFRTGGAQRRRTADPRGELEKVVLAREVLVHAPREHDPAAVLGVLRAEFPSCFSFCIGRGEATLIAASPELLVRREGQRVGTLALAGSTRRSADPAVDDHLGEQLLRDPSYREEHAIVARRIERALRAHSVWVTAAPEPELVRIANIQHLATPIRAQLARPIDALELAAILHPTPAVGGEPRESAVPLIPALEGLDRGWYAGPVGWTDAAGDGEFCVALRCALLRGQEARCYAGNGIVRDSDPARELAETEVKLQALLPLLAG